MPILRAAALERETADKARVIDALTCAIYSLPESELRSGANDNAVLDNP